MSILKDGATYRFENRAAENEVDGKGRSLNVYGNSPSILANVCLWTSDDDDICQQWVYEASATEDRGYLRCKGASNLYLDVYTGSGASTVVGYNAHVYTISNTAYLEVEEISGGYVRIKSMYNGRYLTANQGSNGTSGGKDVNAAGNVYFYGGGLTDRSQDWDPILLEDGDDEEPGSDAKMTLAQLKRKFPDGKYWNHVGMSSNNQDGYTNSPCPTHANENVDTCNAFELNGVEYSWQCMGFAEKCGYDFPVLILVSMENGLLMKPHLPLMI